MLNQLGELARLAVAPAGDAAVEHTLRACAIVREALAADEAYIIRAGDPHFVRLGSDADPTTYEIKQKGYYLIWRELRSHTELQGAGVQVVDRRVEAPIALRVGARPTHLASVLPAYESNSELLIVRGSWPRGLTAAHLEFLGIARPVLASLVGTVLDTERQARQQRQLGLFADVASAFSEAQEMDSVLAAVATAVAKASSFDWVTIVLFDDALERAIEHAQNVARYSTTGTAAQFWQLEESSAAWLFNAREMERTGKPLLWPDVFASGANSPRAHFSRDPATRGRADALLPYYERAHILSAAIFPIRFQNRVLGTMLFSASSGHTFEPDEVAFLTALVSQAAAGIAGLRMHKELRRANASLAHLATHDAPTGLPNRALFIERLTQALAGGRDALGGAVLFLDLDDFKRINDALGHEAGDAVLHVVASRLRCCLPEHALAARLGGDEFAVLLPAVCERTAASAAEQVAAQILVALGEPVSLLGARLHVTASIGISVFPEDTCDAGALVRCADMAMYTAKAAGGNGCRFYARAQAAQPPEPAYPERRRDRALDGDGFAAGRAAAADSLVPVYR